MANKSLTFSSFLEKANKIHENKYDYSDTVFSCTREKIIIKCPAHGEFSQRVSAHLNGQGCKKCRNESVRNRFLETKQDFLNGLSQEKKQNLDFSDFVYINDKTKGIVKCVKHQYIFSTTPSTIKKSKYCCHKCAKESQQNQVKNSKQDFIKLSLEKHGDKFEYDSVPEIFGSHDYIQIKCKECNNYFWRLAYSHCNIGHSCPKCGCSKIHKNLEKFLSENNIKFERNNRSILEGKELDIFIPEKNLAIECNGNYWHSEEILQNNLYHLEKTQQCENKNIKLLHFFEDEILFKKEIVESIIIQKIKENKNKIYARKCIVKEIDYQIKNDFLNDNHIQGQDQSKVKLGLYYNDELVCVMTFGTPRYNDKIEWELIRFCNKRNTNVCGGASKLLSYFEKKYKPKSIISYADKRISDGNLYQKLNFSYSHDSEPRYYYFPKKNPLDRLHRSNFTKSKIRHKFPNADLSKTEKEIMKELGYGRIWDCGTKVYIKIL